MVAAAGCVAFPACSIIVVILIPPEAQRSRSEAEAAHKELPRQRLNLALRVRNSPANLAGSGSRKHEGRSVRVAPMTSASRFITVGNLRHHPSTAPTILAESAAFEKLASESRQNESLLRNPF
jgi:hypothetical protein